jgi:YD repeat-containing protein
MFNFLTAQIEISTPQSYDFVRYGNIKSNSYIGKLDVKVPIYNYKDIDFDFNIFLGYNGEGFRPNKRESIVGLNWFLNVGGGINRVVKGIPDDTKYHPFTPVNSHKCGFYSLAKQKIYTNEDLKFNSIVSQSYNNYPFIKYDNKNYETMPDMFYFNFMGISGKFYFDISGEVKVISDSKIFVDASGFSEQDMSAESNISYSEFVIKDTKGFKYYFGGNRDCLEYSLKIQPDARLGFPVINSWKIRKVIAPNGREIVMKYNDNEIPLPESNGYMIDGNSYILTEQIILNGGFAGGNFSIDNYKIYGITKQSILKEIIIDDCKLSFKYSERSTSFYNNDDLDYSNTIVESTINDPLSGNTPVEEFYKMNQKGVKLDSIIIKNNHSVISSTKLNYSNLGDGGSRMFLTSVRNNLELTSFEYNFDFELPKPSTTSLDHWGFWNGQYIYYPGNLMPIVEFNNELQMYECVTDEREPDTSVCRLTLLEKITYPTGGSTIIEYEPNSYSYKLSRDITSNYIPYIKNEFGFAGGARVKSITDQENNKKVFIYNSLDNTSSGILNLSPIYFMSFKTEKVENITNELDIFDWIAPVKYYLESFVEDKYSIYIPSTTYNFFDISSVTEANYSDNYITYDRVIEKIEGNGRIINEFSSYKTNPDTYIIGFELEDFDTNNVMYYNTDIKPFDRSKERGKIISKKVYNEKEKLDKIYLYEYERSDEEYSVAIDLCRLLYQPHYIYNYNYRLKEEKYIDFIDENTSIDILKKIKYYQKPYEVFISNVTTNSSSYDSLVTKYRYTFGDGLNEVEKAMSDSNIVKLLLEETTTYKNGNIKIVDGKENCYKYFENAKLFLLDTVRRYTKEGYQVELIHQLYDTLGNINEIYIPKADLSTAYKWGYNGQYPIIKAVNAKFSEIESYQVGYSIPQIDDAQITTYKYKPLVGMTEQTDPNGLTTYYKYDDFNRLKTIKDNDGNVLKEYKYRYKKDFKAISKLSISTTKLKEYYLGEKLNVNTNLIGGSGNYKYNWYLNGEKLSYNTKDIELVLNKKNNNQLYLEVVDEYGEQVIESNQLSFNVICKPISNLSISTNSNLFTNTDVIVNSSFIEGSGSFEYKWYVSGSYSSSAKDLTTQFSQPGTYKVKLEVLDTRTLQEVNSNEITLNITYPPLKNERIESNVQEVIVGQTVQLEMFADGGSGDFIYEWGLSQPISKVGTIQGEREKTLSYLCDEMGEYWFGCNLTDNITNKGISAKKIIKVLPIPISNISISASKSNNLYKGQSVNLAANFNGGSSNLSYSWYRNNQLISETSKAITTSCNLSGNNIFKVLITDNNSDKTYTSDEKVLNVICEPITSVNIKPDQSKYFVTESLGVSCEVKGGSDDYKYKWYLNGQLHSTVGSSTSIYLSKDGEYNFKCEVEDTKTGQFYSSDIKQFKVDYKELENPKITGDTVVLIGNPVSLEASVSGGTGSYAYEWGLMFEGSLNLNTKSISYPISEYKEYVFQCQIRDKNSNKSTSVSKSVWGVYPKMSDCILGSKSSSYYVNQICELSVSFKGGSGKYDYSWLLNDNQIPGNDKTLNYKLTSSTSYRFCCEVIDKITGKKIKSKERVVSCSYPELGEPSISASSSIVYLGSTCKLTANIAGGSGSYSYKWTLGSSTVGTEKILNYKINSEKSYNFKCRITDNITKKVKSADISILGYKPSLGFGFEYQCNNCEVARARLYCGTACTVKFKVEVLQSDYMFGNHNFSINGSTQGDLSSNYYVEYNVSSAQTLNISLEARKGGNDSKVRVTIVSVTSSNADCFVQVTKTLTSFAEGTGQGGGPGPGGPF